MKDVGNMAVENLNFDLNKNPTPPKRNLYGKLLSWMQQNDDLIFLGIMAILALLVRWAFIPFRSGDYLLNFAKWYDVLKSGGFAAFKNNFFDYTPPYLYLIWLVTYLPVPAIVAIKLIAIVFDFLAAVLVSLLVKQKYSNNLVVLLSFLAVLFAPTVITNSTIWAQCDMTFTVPMLATIYCLIKGKNWAAFIWYGIAFSFKIQAVFLAPLLVVLLLKGKVKLFHFLAIIAAYIVSVLPCLFAGRPLMDLLLIYPKLVGEYPSLSYGCAGFYQWVGNPDYEMFKNAGIALTAAVITFFGYLSYLSKRTVDHEFIIRLSLLLFLVMPFLMPGMHERYYFPADVLSIAVAFCLPQYLYAAVTISLVSFFSYCENLFGAYVIEPKFLAIVMLLLIIKLSYDFIKFLFRAETTTAPTNC